MVSSSVVSEFQSATKQPTMEGVPDRVSSFFQSTIECNPKIVKNGQVASNSITNATSGALYTVPANQDCYICACNLSWVRDATATSTTFGIQYTNEFGATNVYLITAPGITLTAGNGSVNMTLPHPVKVARGSNIIISSSTNTGNFKVAAQINYFLDENANDG